MAQQQPQAAMEPANDCESPLYKSDEFRMYCFKVLPCSKRYCHDWTTCPFAHPGEKAKRRDPRVFSYTGFACPEIKKSTQCPRADGCPYAHNVFEYWLHPSRYRSQLCNDGTNCKRKVCFFAHTPQELRVPAVKSGEPLPLQAERNPFAPGAADDVRFVTSPQGSLLNTMQTKSPSMSPQSFSPINSFNGDIFADPVLLAQCAAAAAADAAPPTTLPMMRGGGGGGPAAGSSRDALVEQLRSTLNKLTLQGGGGGSNGMQQQQVMAAAAAHLGSASSPALLQALLSGGQELLNGGGGGGAQPLTAQSLAAAQALMAAAAKAQAQAHAQQQAALQQSAANHLMSMLSQQYQRAAALPPHHHHHLAVQHHHLSAPTSPLTTFHDPAVFARLLSSDSNLPPAHLLSSHQGGFDLLSSNLSAESELPMGVAPGGGNGLSGLPLADDGSAGVPASTSFALTNGELFTAELLADRDSAAAAAAAAAAGVVAGTGAGAPMVLTKSMFM